MKSNRLFGWLMAALTLVTMASCHGHFVVEPDYPDPDVEETRTLSGEWEGNFGMWYGCEWHGRYQEFDAAYSNVVFYPASRYATYGTGKQVDFYDYGPYSYQYYYFTWEIRNGVVYLNYPADHALDTYIYDYYMDSRVFDGYFGDSNSHFELDKLANFNWSPYIDEYGYGVRSISTRSTDDADQQPADAPEVKVVKRGRHAF